MFDRLTGEYIGPSPLGQIDFKAERADAKAWYNNLPEARKAVMEVFPRYTCAHTRMCQIGAFLREQGVDPIPKSDKQYELAYERLAELKAWLAKEEMAKLLAKGEVTQEESQQLNDLYIDAILESVPQDSA